MGVDVDGPELFERNWLIGLSKLRVVDGRLKLTDFPSSLDKMVTVSSSCHARGLTSVRTYHDL